MTKTHLAHATAMELFRARTIIQRRIRDDRIALGALELELRSCAEKQNDNPPLCPRCSQSVPIRSPA